VCVCARKVGLCVRPCMCDYFTVTCVEFMKVLLKYRYNYLNKSVFCQTLIYFRTVFVASVR